MKLKFFTRGVEDVSVDEMSLTGVQRRGTVPLSQDRTDIVWNVTVPPMEIKTYKITLR